MCIHGRAGASALLCIDRRERLGFGRGTGHFAGCAPFVEPGITAVTEATLTHRFASGLLSVSRRESASRLRGHKPGPIAIAIASTPATTNQQGLIPQLFGLAGFDLWATANIPSGRDRSFDGDWNQDGIPNGVAYVFGNARISSSGRGRIAIPPTSRSDVDVFLDHTNLFQVWQPIVQWLGGAAPSIIVGGVSLVSGEVVDTAGGPDAFYRYRVVKR